MTNEVEITKCRNKIAKAETDIIRWRRSISDAAKSIELQKSKIEKLEGKEYYVYVVFVDGVPAYVGKGKGSRYKHAVSGMSSCQELNKDFFDKKYIEVMFTRKYKMTEQEALKAEKDWIFQFQRSDEDSGSNLYNKDIPSEGHYWDECYEYFYHRWFVHAIDNKSVEGVRVVKPVFKTAQDPNEGWVEQ